MMYSLIADESTDVSRHEQLCITLTWIDEAFEIHESPIELIDVPKTDAQTLTAVIKDCLTQFSLPTIPVPWTGI